MDVYEAMRSAATVRRYRPDPIPDEVLYRVLDAARNAPSGGNLQGWRVILVRDQELRTRLKGLYLHTWRPFHQARVAQSAQTGAGARPRPGSSDGNHYAEHLDELPVHLLVLVEQAALVTPFPALNESHFAAGSSIYPFVQNLLLASRAEGLGTALTMLLNNEEEEVRRLLAIPEGFSLAAHLGVGWPDRPHPTRLRRRPVEEFTFRDRFDGDPFGAVETDRTN